MAATSYFVALQPDANLTSRLLGTKSKILELVGPQLYLDHPPHLTLYVAAFRDIAPLAAALERLAASTPSPRLDVIGWHVFMQDVLTGRNTLVCEIDRSCQGALRLAQSHVIAASAPLRDVAATEARFVGRKAQLSTERQQAIDAVGFPFIGDDWQPHLSVASISPTDWDVAWPAVEHAPIIGAFTCPQLKLYRLDDGQPVELQAWSFAAA